VLAWLMAGEVSAIPLVGASSVAQLDESLAAVGLELTAQQLARLDAAGSVSANQEDSTSLAPTTAIPSWKPGTRRPTSAASGPELAQPPPASRCRRGSPPGSVVLNEMRVPISCGAGLAMSNSALPRLSSPGPKSATMPYSPSYPASRRTSPRRGRAIASASHAAAGQTDVVQRYIGRDAQLGPKLGDKPIYLGSDLLALVTGADYFRDYLRELHQIGESRCSSGPVARGPVGKLGYPVQHAYGKRLATLRAGSVMLQALLWCKTHAALPVPVQWYFPSSG
jgi:hypothetical protein